MRNSSETSEARPWLPKLGRFALRSSAIVASTCAVYELFLHDWGRGVGFGVSWLLLIAAERRINGGAERD
ncbi:MAG: hypothetical protein AB8E74_08645 [Prochlorococcus sp.]|nr:hypothetical protein [Prochlorococcaceae cyanobacterium Fu_MAG_50]